MGSSWLSEVPTAGIQRSVLCFLSLPVQVFLKAQPLAELLQWELGKWLSCDKGQCHQVLSLPPPLQVLALTWAQFALLLLLLAKAGLRVADVLGCGAILGISPSRRKMS